MAKRKVASSSLSKRAIAAATMMAIMLGTFQAQAGDVRHCIILDIRYHTTLNKRMVRLACEGGKYSAALIDKKFFWEGQTSCLPTRPDCPWENISIWTKEEARAGQVLECRDDGHFLPVEWTCKPAF